MSDAQSQSLAKAPTFRFSLKFLLVVVTVLACFAAGYGVYLENWNAQAPTRRDRRRQELYDNWNATTSLQRQAEIQTELDRLDAEDQQWLKTRGQH